MAIAFDAVAVSSQYSYGGGTGTSPVTMSTGITVGSGGNNYAFVDIIVTNEGNGGVITPASATASVTLGGVTLTSLGYALVNNLASAGFIWRFGGSGVATGSQTASATITQGTAILIYGCLQVTTYTGVGSVGSLQTAYGSTATPGVAISSATGHTVCAVISGYDVASTFSALTVTQRKVQSTNPPFIAGDGAGSSSVTVSATQSNGAYPWAAVGIDMIPAGGGAAPTNQFFSMF